MTADLVKALVDALASGMAMRDLQRQFFKTPHGWPKRHELYVASRKEESRFDTLAMAALREAARQGFKPEGSAHE